MDLVVDGKPVKAVAQPTKQNWLYVFDRITGKPVWPIEERPVEKGDVPGEWYSPTQPFVTKPPAYERHGVTLDDLIDFTPELKAEGAKLASLYKLGPIFTPPVVSQVGRAARHADDPRCDRRRQLAGRVVRSRNEDVLHLHQRRGHGDRSRAAGAGPIRHAVGPRRWRAIRIRTDTRAPAPRRLARRGARRSGRGGRVGGVAGLTVQGLPLIKPPYAHDHGDQHEQGHRQAWRIAHGETPDAIKNHPALKGLTIPRTGRQGRIGVLTTKTLLIAGEGGFNTTPQGRGAMLRAYNKATGAEVGAVYMPAPQSGSPMTYSVNGTQYIACRERSGFPASCWFTNSA